MGTEAEPRDGIEFDLADAAAKDEHGRRVFKIVIDVMDGVPEKRYQADTLYWRGGVQYEIGSLEEARALHQKLGNSIQQWEQMQASGKAVIK